MDVYRYIINQQARGYAADVVYRYVCVHLLYMWVGQVGMCVARGSTVHSGRQSVSSAARFILFIYLLIPTFHIKGFPPRFFRQGH